MDNPPGALQLSDDHPLETLGSFFPSHDGRWLDYRISQVDERNQLKLRAVAIDSTDNNLFGIESQFSGDSEWLAHRIGISPDTRKEDSEWFAYRLGISPDTQKRGQNPKTSSKQAWLTRSTDRRWHQSAPPTNTNRCHPPEHQSVPPTRTPIGATHQNTNRCHPPLSAPSLPRLVPPTALCPVPAPFGATHCSLPRPCPVWCHPLLSAPSLPRLVPPTALCPVPPRLVPPTALCPVPAPYGATHCSLPRPCPVRCHPQFSAVSLPQSVPPTNMRSQSVPLTVLCRLTAPFWCHPTS